MPANGCCREEPARGVSREGGHGARGAPVRHRPPPRPGLTGSASGCGSSANGRSLAALAAAGSSLPGARLLPKRAQSLRGSAQSQVLRPHKPSGAVPPVKVKTSRSQSVNDRKQTWDYSHH